MTLGVKTLQELRVVDLKAELEKRNLDCSGVKAVLVKKLEKALKDQGEDPKTFTFSIQDSISPRKEKSARGENEVNGEKSDDETPLSDDETQVVGESGPADEVNQLSDDEIQDENAVSDDEKQTGEEDQVQSDDERMANEGVKSDDEQIVDEVVKNSEDEQCAADDGKMSDDEQAAPDEEAVKSDDEIPGDDGMQSDDKQMNTNDISRVNDGEKETNDKKMINEDKPEDNEIVQDSVIQDEEDKGEDGKQENDGSAEATSDETKAKEELESKSDSDAPPKKLRPRITAPSDEGTTTKTPILKKDIILPAAKPKDEEFVVPEKEADIYDKDKFIVKEDVMGDCDEPMDFETDISNMDNEDSINLTIGEEDTKFMTEEAGLEGEDKDSSEAKKNDEKKKGSSVDDSSKKLNSSKLDGPKKAKSLWVSGLSSATRATDLKQLFNKHGKVIAAKIVTNAKTPGARCYGFVTMLSHEDAVSCIKALNLTELHGRLISVEPVADKAAPKKMEDSKSPRSERDRSSVRSNSSRRDHTTNGDRGDRRYDRHSSARDDRRRIPHDRTDRRRNDVLSFDQIKAERKKQKGLAVEREMREMDRRKRDDIMRQRDVERRNREEALRLEREREKLKYEREKIERERAELLLLERARLEREKEELKRQKMRLEEDRRLKRPLADRDDYSRSKRPTPDYGRGHSSHHSSRSSPSRHYDKYSERSSSRRDERREHRRSRSPRKSSRERSSSSKGHKGEGDDDKKCYYCGLASHSRWDCPAMDVQCPICGKTGHFGSMCSVLGYKYPAPVYFDGYKAGTAEKWPQEPRVKVPESSSSSWNRSNSSMHSQPDRYMQGSMGTSGTASSRLGPPLYPPTSSVPPHPYQPHPEPNRFETFNRKY